MAKRTAHVKPVASRTRDSKAIKVARRAAKKNASTLRALADK